MQERTRLMAEKARLSSLRSDMDANLKQVLTNEETARYVRWTKKLDSCSHLSLNWTLADQRYALVISGYSYAYITMNDIKKIDSLQDSLILAVKTPHETYMQLEEPEDVS